MIIYSVDGDFRTGATEEYHGNSIWRCGQLLVVKTLDTLMVIAQDIVHAFHFSAAAVGDQPCHAAGLLDKEVAANCVANASWRSI